MELFHHYIEPLTQWLHTHPQTALLITCIIAFAESLAIIGSIIPGSLTMTAIGILAGSGILRIDATLISATIGAILGDGVSYLLGYWYRDHLVHRWPFCRYPNLLAYGQVYFEKHGGKSVLIGRFVGPLRSIIPVIAGMMQMPKTSFFIANSISGVLWSVLYVTPGILIGAASHELSPEQATRFVILILLGLLSIWLLSIGVKALFLRFRYWLNQKLNNIWSASLKYPLLGAITRIITPTQEQLHTKTASLFIALILSICMVVIFTKIHQDTDTLYIVNHPLHICLQSIRTQKFDFIFSVSQQMISALPLLSLYGWLLISILVRHDVKGFFIFLAINFLALFVIDQYHQQLLWNIIANPPGILQNVIDFSIPYNSVYFSSLCVLICFYHNLISPLHWLNKLYSSIILTCLMLGSVSYLYLGDLWLTDLLSAFFLALSLSLIYWILYRKTHPFMRPFSNKYAGIGIILFFITGSYTVGSQLQQTMQNHQIYFTQHVLSPSLWWKQKRPILPVYTRDRIGKVSGVFNIQYVGSIKNLEKILIQKGWKKQHGKIFDLVLNQMKGTSHLDNPLTHNIYLHKKPKLILTLNRDTTGLHTRLQIWQSNFSVQSLDNPVWLGQIQHIHTKLNRPLYAQDPALIPLREQLESTKELKLKTLRLPTSKHRPNALIKANYLLLIHLDDQLTPP